MHHATPDLSFGDLTPEFMLDALDAAGLHADGRMLQLNSFENRVLQVHRGQVPGQEIFVAHYNPLKPRATVQDDLSGKMGGHLETFRAGDIHRMALESPVDQFWMGGIIDKYFGQPGVRYWAVWTNPGSK